MACGALAVDDAVQGARRAHGLLSLRVRVTIRVRVHVRVRFSTSS